MAQRLFIFKNNFLSECLQGRRLLCQFSAVGCTNMTASSSLSDCAASIFIMSPTVKYILSFQKIFPSSIPSLSIKENPFVSANLGAVSLLPPSLLLSLSFSPPCVCVCVSVCQMMSILKRNVESEGMSKSIWAPAS